MTKVHVTRGSGNVFADLGFPEPEEELIKAHFLMLLEQAVGRRRLSRIEIADLTGVDRSKVSALLAGREAGVPCGRLMQMLTRLGYDIDITIRPARRGRSRGQLRALREIPHVPEPAVGSPRRGGRRSKPVVRAFAASVILPI